MGRFEELSEEACRLAREWGPLPRVLELLEQLAEIPRGPDDESTLKDVVGCLYEHAGYETEAVRAWRTVLSAGPDPGRARLLALLLEQQSMLAYLRLGGLRSRAQTMVRETRAGVYPDAGASSLWWAVHDLNLPRALERMQALGAIDRVPGFAELSAIRNERNGDDPHMLPVALDLAGIAGHFQLECGEPRHEGIIEAFGRMSRGAFTPTNATQVPDHRLGEDPYTVEFDFAGRRHSFQAEWMGDCADVGAAWSAANRALAGAGRSERFYWMNQSGDPTDYVCLDQAVARTLEDELLLILDDGVTPTRHQELLDRMRAALV